MGHRYPPPNRFKLNRSFTAPEIAAKAGVHLQTVRNWLKGGLQPIDGQRPRLVSGHELRRFLAEKRSRAKSPCQPDELFCLPCRKPQRPYEGIADFLDMGASGRLTGLCPACGRIMHKRVPLQSLSLLGNLLSIKHMNPSKSCNGAKGT